MWEFRYILFPYCFCRKNLWFLRKLLGDAGTRPEITYPTRVHKYSYSPRPSGNIISSWHALITYPDVIGDSITSFKNVSIFSCQNEFRKEGRSPVFSCRSVWQFLLPSYHRDKVAFGKICQNDLWPSPLIRKVIGRFTTSHTVSFHIFLCQNGLGMREGFQFT